MPNAITLDDLILLAEKGMGWKKVVDGAVAPPGTFWVCVDTGLLLFRPKGHIGPGHAWSPYTNLRHAGMLMRALGISLILSTQDAMPGVWMAQAWSSAAEVVAFGRAGDAGDDEAAMCEAVCQCALKVLKARKEALSTKT